MSYRLGETFGRKGMTVKKLNAYTAPGRVEKYTR